MIKNKTKLLDRDLSILSFNERVLSLAQREDYPLLERLRFLCIVASNLDEFFEVRMPQHLQALQENVMQGL
ncbi:MAG TPA: polyphosphate kinase 1, partial [Methylophilaceae bacterium]|nr:polyphosphate kinase 1 [Methylophilaceae bacterium]